MNLKFIVQSEKKLTCKGYTSHVSSHKIFWKRQNHGDSKMTGGCQRSGVGVKGGMDGSSTEDC